MHQVIFLVIGYWRTGLENYMWNFLDNTATQCKTQYIAFSLIQKLQPVKLMEELRVQE